MFSRRCVCEVFVFADLDRRKYVHSAAVRLSLQRQIGVNAVQHDLGARDHRATGVLDEACNGSLVGLGPCLMRRKYNHATGKQKKQKGKYAALRLHHVSVSHRPASNLVTPKRSVRLLEVIYQFYLQSQQLSSIVTDYL
jgi:hypothetical protein